MSTFVFKAMDVTGAKATGEVDADNKQVVADQLKARGLIVLDISSKHASKEISLDFLKRIKAGDLTIMTRQLATMISSGMTLLRAFYVLEEQVENQLLRETVAAVREDIEAGLNFSDALERHPKVFNPLYVAMVRAGEAGGVLEESLERIADQLEKDDALRRQVKSAMAYPVVVFSFAMLVLIGMIAFIVPVFIGVFKDFGGELPAITQFLVDASHNMWWIGPLFLTVTIGGTTVFKRRLRDSQELRLRFDRFKLKRRHAEIELEVFGSPEIVRAVQQRLQALQPTLPPGVEIVETYNRADLVDRVEVAGAVLRERPRPAGHADIVRELGLARFR